MAQTGTDSGRRKPGRPALVGATLVLLLVVVVGIAAGIGPAMIVLGLVALVVGVAALIRGQARWAFILTRRLGFAVAGAGLVALGVGTAVAPHAKVAADSSSLTTVSPTTSGPTEKKTPAHSRAIVVAPMETPAAITTSRPPAPPLPQMVMTCPSGGSVASTVFGDQITATAPYTVAIDYGDGDHYTNDDQHLPAIFSHTYKVFGNFIVSAVLTDAVGQTTTSTCTYSLTKPVVSTGGSSHNPGGSPSGSSSGGGDTYTNVDGTQVHVPVQAPSAPVGATAQCNDGSWSFSQHHQGTCSGHHGVARWLG